ncbi:hypothetical protein K1T71_013994 [Dendrolimus kikuchii]|uniref:Uncharacterized protein n=1 Tax=Dendrolimus kikuchii TaxID=765133 RepID=A0ACC1CGI2_9NEOP|nr:hypothetical protein K1T71_013994 [Dendrolimus kikuchii]
MSAIPITLTGNTLGQRHKVLNALVDHAFSSDVTLQSIQSIPEQSPIDRLFKIDLASKLRDVDYIIQNLKDYDMLYVSKVLKCKWLLENEYQNIMNPEYLEQDLYPYMITTAVSKMKCWISVNLRDQERCQQFYVYYYERNFGLAIRFLSQCQVSYIIDEIPNILYSLNPFYFKVFCEKSPLVAKIFFDSLSTNEKLLNQYLEKEAEYFESLKVVLKADGNIFLDIIEKYFNNDRFNRLNSVATKYILRNYKDRFTKKIELYAAWLLHMKSMAQCLTVDECKNLILILARAEYLSQWFTYKTVEPLIKRLPPEQRSEFKKKVFVENNVGDKTKEWQYETPCRPLTKDDTCLFDDITHSPREYETCTNLRAIKKRKFCKWEECANIVCETTRRTLLDQLFDEFRFMSFEKTLYELRRRILVESSPQNRQFMMLVLVSKTGGREESVASFLQLLAGHQNEPPHVRATIVRSLTKRACVWRLPQESWKSLMTFAVGLGFDGKKAEADCREGLHAVVLRKLLGSGCIEDCIFSAFMEQFSTLKEYSLTAVEQKAVTERLPALLLASIVNENNSEKQANLFHLLLQTLDDYKLPIDTCPVVPALAALANTDISAAKDLLLRLFNDKKARRELFEQNFACVSTDASYSNALRHNTELLKRKEYIKRALDDNSRREQFFRKLAIYFTETNGLADLYLSALKESLSKKQDVKLARTLACLIGSNLELYLKQLDDNEDKDVKRFAAALKANAHLTKPKLNIETFGYHAIGPKAVANVAFVSRKVDIEAHVATLIKWPRTIRLALLLSERLKMEAQTFAIIANIRPNVALKCGLKYLYRNSVTFNQDVWEVIKPLMKKFNFESSKTYYLSKYLWKVRIIPETIQPDYCTVLYAAGKKNSKAASILCHIENLLPEVSYEFVEDFLSQLLQNNLSTEETLKEEDLDISHTRLFLRIFVKFVLLSTSEEIQKKRFQEYGEPILKLIIARNKGLTEYIEEILNTLRYNTVFFNQQYVSCLPVFERVVSWMHTFCPMEKCFKYYAEVHLTMLFFKSVRQCLKHQPNLFDDKKKCKNGANILGNTFGTYIAKEIDELKSSYFESIVELYRNVLVNYLNVYFPHDVLKETFIINIMRGIIDYGDKTTPLLGVYLFEEIYYLKDGEYVNEIKENLYKKDNQEIQFFLESGKFL